MIKAFLTAVVIVSVFVFGSLANGEEIDKAKIDKEIVEAISARRGVDFNKIDIGEYEKYFQEVFETEKTKILWLKNILRRLGVGSKEQVDVFMSHSEINLAPEPFIQVQIRDFSFTVFKSGTISYAAVISHSENFLLNGKFNPIGK